MKYLVFLLVFLNACSYSTGSAKGVLMDVSFGGMLFNSCEIFIKFKEGDLTQASLKDQKDCAELSQHLGKTLTFEYKNTLFDFTTSTSNLVTSYIVH